MFVVLQFLSRWPKTYPKSARACASALHFSGWSPEMALKQSNMEVKKNIWFDWRQFSRVLFLCHETWWWRLLSFLLLVLLAAVMQICKFTIVLLEKNTILPFFQFIFLPQIPQIFLKIRWTVSYPGSSWIAYTRALFGVNYPGYPKRCPRVPHTHLCP